MNTAVVHKTHSMPSSPIRFPKTSNYTHQEIQSEETNTYETYKVQPTSNVFDPTIINTPPNEFMNQLKQRINVYYSSK